jgi:hypothetical protein
VSNAETALATARAALSRLALSDEMAGMGIRDDDPEVRARCHHAAGALTTIDRIMGGELNRCERVADRCRCAQEVPGAHEDPECPLRVNAFEPPGPGDQDDDDTLARQAGRLLTRLRQHELCLDDCGGLSDIHGEMYALLEKVQHCEQVQ